MERCIPLDGTGEIATAIRALTMVLQLNLAMAAVGGLTKNRALHSSDPFDAMKTYIVLGQ